MKIFVCQEVDTGYDLLYVFSTLLLILSIKRDSEISHSRSWAIILKNLWVNHDKYDVHVTYW